VLLPVFEKYWRGLIYVDYFFSPSDGMEIDIGPVRRMLQQCSPVIYGSSPLRTTKRRHSISVWPPSGHIGCVNLLLFTFRHNKEQLLIAVGMTLLCVSAGSVAGSNQA
jgi:hypothetical protein